MKRKASVLFLLVLFSISMLASVNGVRAANEQILNDFQTLKSQGQQWNVVTDLNSNHQLLELASSSDYVTYTDYFENTNFDNYLSYNNGTSGTITFNSTNIFPYQPSLGQHVVNFTDTSSTGYIELQYLLTITENATWKMNFQFWCPLGFKGGFAVYIYDHGGSAYRAYLIANYESGTVNCRAIDTNASGSVIRNEIIFPWTAMQFDAWQNFTLIQQNGNIYFWNTTNLCDTYLNAGIEADQIDFQTGWGLPSSGAASCYLDNLQVSTRFLGWLTGDSQMYRGVISHNGKIYAAGLTGTYDEIYVCEYDPATHDFFASKVHWINPGVTSSDRYHFMPTIFFDHEGYLVVMSGYSGWGFEIFKSELPNNTKSFRSPYTTLKHLGFGSYAQGWQYVNGTYAVIFRSGGNNPDVAHPYYTLAKSNDLSTWTYRTIGLANSRYLVSFYNETTGIIWLSNADWSGTTGYVEFAYTYDYITYYKADGTVTSSWEHVRTTDANVVPGNGIRVEMTIDSSNRPVLAYVDAISSELGVSWWNGHMWVQSAGIDKNIHLWSVGGDISSCVYVDDQNRINLWYYKPAEFNNLAPDNVKSVYYYISDPTRTTWTILGNVTDQVVPRHTAGGIAYNGNYYLFYPNNQANPQPLMLQVLELGHAKTSEFTNGVSYEIGASSRTALLEQPTKFCPNVMVMTNDYMQIQEATNQILWFYAQVKYEGTPSIGAYLVKPNVILDPNIVPWQNSNISAELFRIDLKNNRVYQEIQKSGVWRVVFNESYCAGPPAGGHSEYETTVKVAFNYQTPSDYIMMLYAGIYQCRILQDGGSGLTSENATLPDLTESKLMFYAGYSGNTTQGDKVFWVSEPSGTQSPQDLGSQQGRLFITAPSTNSLFGWIAEGLSSLFVNTFGPALWNLWNWFVTLIDIVFSAFGWHNGFSQILSIISGFTGWFTTALTFIFQFFTITFNILSSTLIAAVSFTIQFFNALVFFYNNLSWIWLSMYPYFGWVLPLIGELWPLLMLFGIVWLFWPLLSSLSESGHLDVGIRDTIGRIEMTFGLLWKAMMFMWKLVDFVIDTVYRLVESVPIVE